MMICLTLVRTVSLWRRDAAGNEAESMASVPVTLRYDPDAPQLGFEPSSFPAHNNLAFLLFEAERDAEALAELNVQVVGQVLVAQRVPPVLGQRGGERNHQVHCVIIR